MSSENDDDWAELARELARDTPQPPVAEQTQNEGLADTPERATGADSTTYGMKETVEGGAEPGLDGGAEPGTDEQPGTGRKRRRRRRRRRRGGTEQTVEAGAAETDESEGDEPGEGVESEQAGDFESSEAGFSDEVEEEHDTELVASEVEADEDAGGELLRDLIANWNVPSWDDVVGGLYRPER